MSDPNGTAVPTVTVDPTTPAAAPAPPATAPAPVAAVPAKPATDPNAEPTWLPDRLERERKKILSELGIENVHDAKTALAELKAKQDAAKSEAQKTAEAQLAAQKANQDAAALRATITEHAARQMIGLTAEQKAAVVAIAGEDPALQLKTISALQPTWATQATATQTANQPAAAKPVDTAPAPNAPPPTTTSPTNHRAQYEALQKTNPFAAAQYGLAHAREVFGDG